MEFLEKDPINLLSKAEMDNLIASVGNLPSRNLIEIRGYAQVIKNNYRTTAFTQSPISTTVYENSTIAKIDILHTKKAAAGFNYIAKKASQEGQKEGQSLLEKLSNNFSQNVYGDKIIRAADSAFTSFNQDTQSTELDLLKPFKQYNEFEKSKPLSVSQAETVAQNDEQLKSLQERVGTTKADPKNKPVYDTEKGYLSNFASEEAAKNLLKSCIPCDFRKYGKFKADFGVEPWAITVLDFNKKLAEMQNMLKSLWTNEPGAFSTDLCELFKFLDGQCLPDIAGLMSLLSMMQLKYFDLSLGSLSNIINQLLAPFLTPVIGSFTSNLDKYADLIIGPLRCVVAALEKQIITLQDQINGAINIGNMNKTKFYEKEAEFYDAKIKSLRNRRLEIEKDKITRLNRDNLDGKVRTPNQFAQYGKGKIPDLTRDERIIKTKLVTGGIRLFGETTAQEQREKAKDKSYQSIYDEELETIKGEIDVLVAKKNETRTEISKISPYSPTNFNGAVSITRATENALQNYERAYKSMVGTMTDAINDGINIVKQAIDMYREELQRLLLGRISNQQDQLEYARMLQQIQRISSIVGTINYFKKNGLNIQKFCEQGNANALGQIAKGLKENGASGMYDFYDAVNSDGQPLIVIAPGGAKVTVSSLEFDDIGNDALFSDSSVTLESVTKKVSFNDLNEVDRLNREGIAPSLGNIDSKKIELSNNLKPGSQLDLHFKNSYAIISNEFCSKSAINFGSSDTVKKWAEGLWQKS